jgi:hypothetical protein
MTQVTNFPAQTTGTGMRTLAFDNNEIMKILAATRAGPSWRACMVENTDWNGTASENTAKYLETIGTQDAYVS